MNIACTVCLDRFFLSSIISASPCGHLFHDKCLDRWIIDERKKTCPQCRTSITPKQIIKKLYFMEPLCQTQMLADNHNSSELLHQIETQETKLLESEQRCRKLTSDVQKTEERRQAFEKDTIMLRKQLSEQAAKHQRMINERDAKINILIEQNKHADLSNKKDEQIKVLQTKLSEYRNIDIIYKGLASTFKSELQKMLGSCQTIQDKDRFIQELVRYNVILKEQHSKMSDDKQDLVRNLDRITAQCEKMQLEKRQAIQRQKSSKDDTKEELTTLRQQVETYQTRINQLESLLHRNITSNTSSHHNENIPTNLLFDNENMKEEEEEDDDDDDDDDTDSNMIDLTNANQHSSSPIGFSTQQFSTTSSAIDILHSIIQQTTTTVDLNEMKKIKVRKLDDDTEQNHDYLVRPFVQNQQNFQRTFNKFGGHSMPFNRRINNNISFKSKTKSNNKSRHSTATTRNNHKITSFFDIN